MESINKRYARNVFSSFVAGLRVLIPRSTRAHNIVVGVQGGNHAIGPELLEGDVVLSQNSRCDLLVDDDSVAELQAIQLLQEIRRRTGLAQGKKIALDSLLRLKTCTQ